MNWANDSLSVQWTVPNKVKLLGTSLIISDLSQCVQTMGIHGSRHSIIGQIHTDFSPMGNSRCFAGISLAYLPLDYLACDACLNCVLFSTSRCTYSPFVFSCVIYFYLSLYLHIFFIWWKLQVSFFTAEGDMQRLSHALKILSESEKQLRMSRNQSTWLTAALLQLSSLEASAVDVNDSKSSIRNGHDRGQDVNYKH